MSYNHNGTYVCKNCGKEVFVNVMEEDVPNVVAKPWAKTKELGFFLSSI